MKCLCFAVFLVASLTCPVTAGLVTVSREYTGIINDFGDNLFIFTGNPDNFVPITDIHVGDTFHGTTTFTFDPDQPPGSFDIYGATIATTIVVDGHIFSTTQDGLPTDQVYRNAAVVGETPGSFMLWYQSTMSNVLPVPFLYSTLNFTGTANLSPDTPFWTSFLANMDTFQGGYMSFHLARGDPSIWRDEFEIGGSITSLAAPEPSTLSGLMIAALFGTLIYIGRRIKRKS